MRASCEENNFIWISFNDIITGVSSYGYCDKRGKDINLALINRGAKIDTEFKEDGLEETLSNRGGDLRFYLVVLVSVIGMAILLLYRELIFKKQMTSV